MKLQTLALIAGLSAVASSALAEDRGQATLQKPLAAPVRTIAGGATWDCDGAACVTASQTVGDTLSVWSCKTLVRNVGPVSVYTLGAKRLAPDALARCNAAAAKG